MTSQTGQQIWGNMCVVTTTHILPNISRTKGNQIMKKLFASEKQVINTLILTYFGKPRLGIQ